MIKSIKNEINRMAEKTIFSPNTEALSDDDWNVVLDVFLDDYKRYYTSSFVIENIKYFPGLLATFFYRISRELFLKADEKSALEFSSLGFSLTSIEMYFSSDIGKGLKINHGVGTVIGSRTKLGSNVLLHQTVTIGEKNGGRAKIGDNVVIYPGAIVVGDVFIGNNSIIGANVFVDKSYANNSKII